MCSPRYGHDTTFRNRFQYSCMCICAVIVRVRISRHKSTTRRGRSRIDVDMSVDRLMDPCEYGHGCSVSETWWKRLLEVTTNRSVKTPQSDHDKQRSCSLSRSTESEQVESDRVCNRQTDASLDGATLNMEIGGREEILWCCPVSIFECVTLVTPPSVTWPVQWGSAVRQSSL